MFRVQGEGCQPVVAFLDEIFRTGMSKLPKYATTVCGRNISLLVTTQCKAQMDAEYGQYKARELKAQFIEFRISNGYESFSRKPIF